MSKVLTSKFVESVKPPAEGMAEYWDAALPGFSLRVMASGYKSFSFRYRASDGYKRLSWKCAAFTLSEARGEAEAAVRAVERGEAPKPRQEAISAVSDGLPTLYLAHLKKTVRRWKTAESELAHVLPWKERSKAELKALVAEIAKKYPVQANRVLSRVRAMYTWAIGEDLTELNPTLGIKKPTKEKTRRRILSDEELKKVWLGCGELDYPAREIFRLLILNGQRRDEVRCANRRELDPLTGWVIPAERYKSKRDHFVPLTDTTRPMLERYVSANSIYTNLQKPKRKLDKIAGVKGWTLHDLRRTMRSGLGRLGIPFDIAERVIGHAVGGKLGQTYDVWDYKEEKRAALERWESFVMGLVEDKVVSLRRA